ncbi:hypothetical protein LLG95_06665 [bacterium]|nr:hypothetical protein [bacterium]
MKIDMSPEAVTRRLEEVDELRETCLALADNDAFRRIREKHPDNPVVQRTAQALGESPKPKH